MDNIINQEQFEEYMDTPDGENYCDSNFAYLLLDIDGGDQWEALNGEYIYAPYWYRENEPSRPEYRAQYVRGYYEPMNYGDIVTIDGKEHQYCDGVLLSAEMEHQLSNGELVYEYRGNSYLRIFTSEF